MKKSSLLFRNSTSPAHIRLYVQVTVFAAAVLLPSAVFHMMCPFGGVTTLTRLISQGLFIPKTGVANLILTGAVLVATLVAGPVFCGWLCPLGSVQEWAGRLAGKAGLKKVRIPRRVDFGLSLLRFVILGLVLRATFMTVSLAFMRVDPYYALMHFWTGEVALPALIILAAVLILSVFIDRPWCRWFCPLGGILSVTGRISLFKIRRPAKNCVSCGACAKACPVSLDPSSEDVVTDSRCIRCGLCAPSCPDKIRTEKKSYRRVLITALALFVLVFAVSLFLPRTHGEGSSGTQAIGPHSTIEELAVAQGKTTADVLQLLDLPAEYEPETRLFEIEDDFEEKTWQWIQSLLD